MSAAKYCIAISYFIITVVTTISHCFGQDIKQMVQAAHQNPDSMISVLTTRLEGQKTDQNTSIFYYCKGIAHQALGEYEKAIESYSVVLTNPQISDSLRKATNFCLGNLLHQTGNFQQANERFRKALPSKSTYPELAIKVLNNHANLLSEMGKHEKAREMYEDALPIALKLGKSYMAANLYHNIAITYGSRGDLSNTEIYELKALKELEKNPDLGLAFKIELSLASLYMDHGMLTKAEQYLQKIERSPLAKESSFMVEILRNKAGLAFRKSDFEKSTLLYQQAFTLYDSISVVENSKTIAELEERFKAKEQKQALKEANQQLEEAKLRQIIWGLVAAGLILISILLYRQYLLSKIKNKLLISEKEKAELESNQLLQEKLLIERENAITQFNLLKAQVQPHFLFNALTTLSGLMGVDLDRAQTYLGAFSGFLRKMLDRQNDTLITLEEEYKLCQQFLHIISLRFSEGIQVNWEVGAAAMNQYLPPFALQMVLENAIKHNIVTKDKPLNIWLYSEETEFLLIKNNLQPRSASPTESTGTGLKNIAHRYSLFSEKQPAFICEDGYFVARLPLLPSS